MNIRSIVKKKILGGLELLPFGRDIYLRIARNRLGISYRGIFCSFEEAKLAVSEGVASNYDEVNKNKAEQVEREKQGLDIWFHDTDYPMLFWLSQILGENTTVLELGGSVGHSFYTLERFFSYPAGIQWNIAELQEAVKLGRKIADERNEKRLLFIESEKIASLAPAKIFLTAGTLQYMETALPELLQSLQALPYHVMVHDLPSHCKKSFWTLQNLGLCEVPYRIHSSEGLITAMEKLGFELVAKWKKDRMVEIPFHLDLKVDGYLGYYFRLLDEVTS